MSIAGERKWVYTATVKGRFQRIHRWSGLALQAVLFLVPWVTIGGHPLLLVDLPLRRLFFLGEVYTPEDAIFVVLIGLFTAFSMFFLTALYGRLWCGYACPQTVFLEEWIRPLETLIEGERGAAMARDRGPWTLERASRKLLKWFAFAAVSVVVALAFQSYFSGAWALWTGTASTAAYAMVGVWSATMFLDFAWFREQFCNYLCPYARFQGALTDDESLVISYKRSTGEPRRVAAQRIDRVSLHEASTGACINCKKCVAACPQGIDIREGFQLECIACGRCIDACENVMEKFHRPGLIAYTTTAAEQGLQTRFLRPRTVAYAALLTVIAGAFVVLAAGRQEIDASVVRAPGTLYTVDPDGSVRNTYLLRVTNTDSSRRAEYRVAVDGLDGAEVIVPPLSVEPAASVTVPVVVRLPGGRHSARTTPLEVVVATEESRVVLKATFKTDEPRGGS